MRTNVPRHDTVERRLESLRAEFGRVGAAADPDSDLEPDLEEDWTSGGTRLPTWRPVIVPPQEPEPVWEAQDAPPVPVPGRHASRRVQPARFALPQVLRGRLRIEPWHAVVAAVAVAVAALLGGLWVVRGQASATQKPVASPVAKTDPSPLVALSSVKTAPSASAGTLGGAASPGAEGSTVVVDVEGKVAHPGVVELPSGSRVADAIRAAGGSRLRHRAELGAINLAAVLTDGQQIVVGVDAAAGADGSAGSAAAGSSAGSSATSAGSGVLINLNSATLEELDTLPGVGPVTAQAIVDWRTQNGGFTSVQELLDVDGIGPATLAKLTPLVTV